MGNGKSIPYTNGYGKEIAEVVGNWTGIPVSRLAQEETERLKNLEEVLHQRVIGQEEAVSAISKAIRRGRVGLMILNVQ